MILIAIICIILFIPFYIWSNKIHIDYKSFFRKGFKKIDSPFGVYAYTGKQRKTGKHTAL